MSTISCGAGSLRDAEKRLADLAVRQHGVGTRGQLLQLGFSPATIGRRVARGRFRALYRGVYLVGPLAPDQATPMAAALAGGEDALISHTSGARIWRLAPSQASEPVHVSVPGTGRGGRPGIHFHRVAPWTDHERAVVDGIPVTSPGRTLVDLAGMVGSRELEQAMAVAAREGLIDARELAGLPDRYPRRPGMAMLRVLLRDLEGPSLTRSEAERRCLDLLRRAGLPRPHTNVPIGPYELDLFWPEEGVAIEIDGRAHHSRSPRFEGDRRKDMWLHARGIQVVRLTWRAITRDAMASAVQVGQILALAGAGKAPR